MERGSERVVFFLCETSRELQVARIPPAASSLEITELFRAVAEAGPRDVLKLVNSSEQLVNINPSLPSNNREQPYRLVVVAAPTEVMLPSGTEFDLQTLEERVARLEQQMQAECGHLPPAITDLKSRVDHFRVKLETTEHLSWLGFNKNCVSPVPTKSRHAPQYIRKSDAQKQRVHDKFLNICDLRLSEDVRQRLRQPSFDCCQWEDEEVLLLLQQMFLDLGLIAEFNISLPVLRNFLSEVYNNYNDIPFHNFRHGFCVAQMMYAIMFCVDLPSKVGGLEALVLLTSCICHDLDHPGFNNIYQINARTELALRYNDISPLENHHCSVAFHILEQPEMNIFQSLHGDTYRQVREGIIRCILATDMARHNEILAQFRDIIPEFDYSNNAHVHLLSMVLIKVADISNEARPMEVAEPWLDRLLQEFFKQSDAEKLEGLPVTPFMDREKITKPSSQCSFIGFVLLPLFEALGELFTELQEMMVRPVREALDYYRHLNDSAKDERSHRKSVVEGSSSDSMATCGNSMAQSASAHSVRSRRSLPALALRTRSHSTDYDEESAHQAASVEEMREDVEAEEMVTEVEASEKALKFKISTEGSIGSGRKSYPGSRKGSRDKSLTQDCHIHDFARAMRDKDREYRRADFAREYSRVSSASPVSSQGEAEGLLEALREDVANMHKDICNGGAEGTKHEDICICKTCRMAGNGTVEKNDQMKHISRARDDKVLREQVSETVSCCLDSCRGYGDYRSGSIYDQSSENGTGVRCNQSSEDTIHKSECVTTDVGKVEVTQHHKSILSRIRNFADRISFGSSYEKDGDGKPKHNHLLTSSSYSTQSSPTTPKHNRRVLKAQSSIRDDSPSTSLLTAVSPSDNSSKAMTLPKVKRSQRQNGNHRSWRLFLTASKSDIPSSPELLSDIQFHSSPPNGKKHIFRSKKNICSASETIRLASKHGHCPVRESGEASSVETPTAAVREGKQVSGSLDSMLQVKGMARNHKLDGGGGSTKHSVLLTRMGRSGSEDSSYMSPRGPAHHSWMTSITSSLRHKRTREQDQSTSTSTLHE